MMGLIRTLYYSALISLIGALFGCTPLATPIAMMTATVIPSTATATMLPATATIPPPASVTPIDLSTPDNEPNFTPLLENTAVVDTAFTEQVVGALADTLNIPINRVQVVSIETGQWDADTFGCPNWQSNYDGVLLSEFVSEETSEGLHYQLLVGNTLYTYHSIGTERFVRCPGQERISGEILVLVDPFAAETFQIVQNLLASELDLSSRRVQLVDMRTVVWSDTSLGCPQPEQTYSQANIPGYHVVVEAGNNQYIYHSDSITAYPCPLEQSIIQPPPAPEQVR
ncbi:MAG: hypothetical protein ACFE0Q_07320 [Anaerolineae bacterium]